MKLRPKVERTPKHARNLVLALTLLGAGLVAGPALAAGHFQALDSFDQRSFENNDGLDAWAAPWEEHDLASGGAGASSGTVQIVDGELRLEEHACTGSDPWLLRQVNLDGFASATLSFDYRSAGNVEYWAEIAVEIYYDGGWYHMLEQFGDLDGERSGSKIYDISPFISANTEVRLRIANGFCANDAYLFVDDLQITASSSAGGGAVNRTVKDEFSSADWGNNDGPDNWVLTWVEDDPQSGGSGPWNGQVRITGGELRLSDRPNTGGQPSAARRVDLAGVTDAVVSFDFRTSAGVDTSDAIVVEVSSTFLDCPMCAPHDWDYHQLEWISGLRGAVSGSRSYSIPDHLTNGYPHPFPSREVLRR